MNIAHELKLFQPAVVKPNPTKVSEVTLKAVYNAVSNGFNVTADDISRTTSLSPGCVSKAIKELFSIGILSRINIKNGKRGVCYAYTAIKPLKGDL